MITQTELFPQAEADRAQAVLDYLLTRREKAEKALATAEQNLEDVNALISKQLHVLKLLRANSVTQATLAPDVVDVEAEPEDAEVLAIDGVAVTPDGTEYATATGEIVEASDDVEEGDQPAGEAEDGGMVLTQWPGEEEPTETTVGSRTRFGQLVAEYLSEEGIDHEVDAFAVVGPEGVERSLRDVIPPGMYGQTFRIVRKATEQIEDDAA